MTARGTDRLLGAILVIVSVAWCWGVASTIPSIEDGSRLGARGFPFGLGVMLGILGAIVFGRSFFEKSGDEDASRGDTDRGIEIWAVAGTVLVLTGYAALLEYTGFLIATFVTTVAAVGPVLGVWRPVLMAGMGLGLSLGIYLVFGKLMGVYLPHGSWINLAF